MTSSPSPEHKKVMSARRDNCSAASVAGEVQPFKSTDSGHNYFQILTDVKEV